MIGCSAAACKTAVITLESTWFIGQVWRWTHRNFAIHLEAPKKWLRMLMETSDWKVVVFLVFDLSETCSCDRVHHLSVTFRFLNLTPTSENLPSTWSSHWKTVVKKIKCFFKKCNNFPSVTQRALWANPNTNTSQIDRVLSVIPSACFGLSGFYV